MPAWFTAWAETVSLFDVILWLGGALAVILFIKRGWPAVKKFAGALFSFVQIVDSVAGLPAFIERTDATLAEQHLKIESIHHETHTNNGSSIKDAQLRTENAVERIEIGVKGLYDEVDKLQAADKKLADDIEHTQPRTPFAPYPPSKE